MPTSYCRAKLIYDEHIIHTYSYIFYISQDKRATSSKNSMCTGTDTDKSNPCRDIYFAFNFFVTFISIFILFLTFFSFILAVLALQQKRRAMQMGFYMMENWIIVVFNRIHISFHPFSIHLFSSYVLALMAQTWNLAG